MILCRPLFIEQREDSFLCDGKTDVCIKDEGRFIKSFVDILLYRKKLRIVIEI